MDWRVEYLGNYHIVELHMIGMITGPDLMASVADRIALGRETGVSNFIVNSEKLLAHQAAVTDVLDLPIVKYREEDMDRSSRMAVLRPLDPDSAWLADFYETVCVNRGWNAHICADRESAIRWLLDE